MNLDLTLSRLQDKGHRITKTRKAVLGLFAQSIRPVAADEIREKLRDAGLSVNRATVYRELQFLLSNGYIAEVYLYPDRVCYESSELSHHHHLVCETCGNIENVTNCLVEDLEEDVYKKKGFKIKRHTLEFYGACAKCLKNA
jgi:Fe2+ or Zn2+ uptake regulation protein